MLKRHQQNNFPPIVHVRNLSDTNTYFNYSFKESHAAKLYFFFLTQAEDAVCLADYCDIMRCDVLGIRDLENSADDGSGHLSTDIQVWRENTEQQQRQRQQQKRGTSVVPCESRGLARMYPTDKSCSITGGSTVTNMQRYCRRDDHGGEMHNHRLARSAYHNEIVGPDNKSNACDGEEEDEDEDDEDIEDEEENMVEAALPAVNRKQRRKGLHLRKLKSNCKPEELQKLKTQCEVSRFEIEITARLKISTI